MPPAPDRTGSSYGNFEGAFSMTLIKADAQLRGNNER
jgi:hypothetical protein